MTPFKNYTGLTQEEMAIYLGITRSQWSMFAVGKRKLPIDSTKKLNDLLHYLQNNNMLKDKSKFFESENKKLKIELKRKLLDLEVLYIQTEKKVNGLYTIRQQIVTALSTIAFLKIQEHNDSNLNKMIEMRINKSLEKNSLDSLLYYQQKKQNIENEMIFIKQIINGELKNGEL